MGTLIQKPAKRIRHPGLMEASKKLGVCYQHLRRVVIGERPGKSLLRRYRQFKKTGIAPAASAGHGKHHNSPKTLPPSINQAAAENLSPMLFANLEKLGFQVVIVHFTWADKPAIMAEIQCEGDLEALLMAARAGNYDSTAYDTGVLMHFFHVTDLGNAMQILKDGIAARGLLHRATILHAETNNQLRIWYPPHHPETQLVNG